MKKKNTGQTRFVAEYTSSLGQYGTASFNAKTYASAYKKAANKIKDKPKWAIGAVAPKSDKKLDTTPLGSKYRETVSKITKEGFFRYRS
jgi:hypothetical protein